MTGDAFMDIVMDVLMDNVVDNKVRGKIDNVAYKEMTVAIGLSFAVTKEYCKFRRAHIIFLSALTGGGLKSTKA